MHLNINPVLHAIETHRAALLADEASFDEHGQPVDLVLVDQTGTAGIAAYDAFIKAPCTSVEDIQAKLDYLLNGSVGVRKTLLDCLTAEEYGGFDGQKVFLRSLILEGAK